MPPRPDGGRGGSPGATLPQHTPTISTHTAAATVYCLVFTSSPPLQKPCRSGDSVRLKNTNDEHKENAGLKPAPNIKEKGLTRKYNLNNESRKRKTNEISKVHEEKFGWLDSSCLDGDPHNPADAMNPQTYITHLEENNPGWRL